MKDIILLKYGVEAPEISCLDKGFVKLIDCMPRLVPDGEETADYAIPKAARMSYMRDRKTLQEDITLTRYLKRNNHSSPFEKIKFQFIIKLPIFVARQLIRHRMVNLNELSGRYTEMPEEYFLPNSDDMRSQSKSNSQGSDGLIDEANIPSRLEEIEYISDECFAVYHRNLENGIAKEISRIVLPLSTYTVWDWTIDLHNLLHLLDVRCDHHAQKEIQIYANAILDIVRPIIPHTIEAWEDYSPYRNGLLLTRFEVESLKKYLLEVEELKRVTKNTELYIEQIEPKNKFERAEWKQKLEKIGFGNLLKDD